MAGAAVDARMKLRPSIASRLLSLIAGVGVGACAVAGEGGDPQKQPMNLAAVMRLAGADSLDIKLAEQRLAEAQAAHEAALLQFFPYVTPGVSFRGHEGNIQTVDGQIIETDKQSLSVGASVTAHLELGDAIYRSMVARRLVAAARHGAEAQRQESVYRAVSAYFDLVLARAARGVAREAVRIADSYAGELGRAVEAGIAFKGDAFRSLAQAERERLTMRQAEERQRIASARLAQALHISPLIVLVPEGGEPAPMAFAERDTAPEALVARAMEQRAELHQSAAQLAAAAKARDGAKWGPLIPTIRGEYSYGGLGGGVYEQGATHRFDESADYGIGLSWRLGPGGLFDTSRLRGSEARVQIGELEWARLRDEIARQVVEAHARAHSLADQIEFSRRALSAAEQSLKLARQRQQFGVGEVLENIQAAQDLTRARLDYLTAITEHNRAQFALRRAVGK
jgi:outer membrane protein TolC